MAGDTGKKKGNKAKKNATSFKPGQVANPNGRPKKGTSLTEILRELGDVPPGKTGKARKELIAEKLWRLALSGDKFALRYVYDRLDGKPKETKEISGPDGEGIEIHFVGGAIADED
jgi:hypothetical protein